MSVYEDNLNKALIKELEKQVINLKSQLQRLQRIYRPKIESMLSQVSMLRYLGYDGMELAGSSYFFVTINGLYQEDYTPTDFFKDIDMLVHALGYDTSRIIFTTEETLSLLEDYLISITEAIKSGYFSFMRLIHEKSINTPDAVIKAILVREELYSTFLKINELLSRKTKHVDIRFIAALFIHGLNLLLSKWIKQQELLKMSKRDESEDWLEIVEEKEEDIIKIEPWTIHELYDYLKANYPIAYGEDIYFDILFSQVITPHYEILVRMGQKLIEEKKEKVIKLEVEGETLKKQESAKEKMIIDGSLMRLNLEIAITSALHITRDFSEKAKSEIMHIVDSLLRQKMMAKFGNLYIKEKEKMIELILEELYTLLESEPFFALGVLDYSEVRNFTENPRRYVERNKPHLREKLKRSFRARIGATINYHTIGRSVVSIVEEAVRKMNRLRQI